MGRLQYWPSDGLSGRILRSGFDHGRVACGRRSADILVAHVGVAGSVSSLPWDAPKASLSGAGNPLKLQGIDITKS